MDQAKERALDAVAAMRYGQGGTGYFTLLDFEPVILMHPFHLEMLGKNVDGYKDSNGVALYHDTVAVVQRDRAGQRQRPYRGVEAGIVQRPFPARLFAIKASGQMKLTGYRLALHLKLEIVLFFVTFGIQSDQINVHVGLRNALHAQVQVTANLIGGFHIPFDANPRNGQRLPAQVIGTTQAMAHHAGTDGCLRERVDQDEAAQRAIPCIGCMHDRRIQ